MSINTNFYYTYKRQLEEAQKKPISQIKERAWLLENLAKELLNNLASEWLGREEYEREVGILGGEETPKLVKTAEEHEAEQQRILDERFVLGVEEKKKTEPCIFLVQKILKNTPESANKLFQLLLDFKFKVEEGIGEKE